MGVTKRSVRAALRGPPCVELNTWLNSRNKTFPNLFRNSPARNGSICSTNLTRSTTNAARQPLCECAAGSYSHSPAPHCPKPHSHSFSKTSTTASIHTSLPPPLSHYVLTQPPTRHSHHSSRAPSPTFATATNVSHSKPLVATQSAQKEPLPFANFSLP